MYMPLVYLLLLHFDEYIFVLSTQHNWLTNFQSMLHCFSIQCLIVNFSLIIHILKLNLFSFFGTVICIF